MGDRQIEPEIGVRNPEAFKVQLQTFKGEPGNNTALVQLMISNKAVLETDPSGQRFEQVLKFIYDAGGPNKINNVVEFMKHTFKTMPQAAKDRQQHLTDQYFKEYWEWFDTL
jgi:hypothetical protein